MQIIRQKNTAFDSYSKIFDMRYISVLCFAVLCCSIAWRCNTLYGICWISLYCIVFVFHCIVLHFIVLFCISLYCFAFHCIVLFCILLYCFVFHCIVLYCIVLHCIVLYRIVLCCVVLYCVVSC